MVEAAVKSIDLIINIIKRIKKSCDTIPLNVIINGPG
jgi:hypothetical protein